MKIVCTSDLHGNLPDVPACDLFIISGDICPATNHDPYFQVKWLEKKFNPWLKSIQADKIVGILGNHDFVGEFCPHLIHKIDLNWTLLNNTGIEYQGFQIWGSPYTPQYGNWAFMKPDMRLADCWDQIPDNVDILITHGPPHDILDKNMDGDKCGSKTLTKRLNTISPKFHVFGHIHPSFGQVLINDTTFINAALLNDYYKVVNKPVIIEMENK